VGRNRSERGAVLIEFALVAFFVGIPMLIGGLFVFSAIIAKTQATGDTPTAANFLAAGGCPSATTTSTTPTTGIVCADGVTPSAHCPQEPFVEYDQADPTDTTGTTLNPDSPTAATLCEIDQIVGGTLFDTDSSSLQTAIYCTSPSLANQVGKSEQPCAGATAVWACVRAWDGNAFTNIIGPLWISSTSEQMLPPTTEAAPATTAAGATTTTTTAAEDQYPDFDTFFPANTYNENGADAMTCGPPATTTTTGL